MHRLIKKVFFSLAIFAAFCIAGFLTQSTAIANESIIAGSAIFGASFLTIVVGGIKLWYDVFH